MTGKDDLRVSRNHLISELNVFLKRLILEPGIKFGGNVNEDIMSATNTKQGTSDFLSEMRFWYHFKKHTFSFN